VVEVESEVKRELELKGYQLTDVRTLTRESPSDHAVAIEAWLQGMSEGTIEPSAERRRNIELEAKVHGLLINRSLRIDAKTRMDGATLDKVLLTLAPDKVTISKVSPERMKRAEQAGLIPGIKLDDDEVH
jgi:hypothetical protein